VKIGVRSNSWLLMIFIFPMGLSGECGDEFLVG
jgi:hypothetical protein